MITRVLSLNSSFSSLSLYPSSFIESSTCRQFEDLEKTLFYLESQVLTYSRSRVVYCGPNAETLLRQKVRGIIRVLLESPVCREVSLDIAIISFSEKTKNTTLIIGSILLDVATGLETKVLSSSLLRASILDQNLAQAGEDESFAFFRKVHEFCVSSVIQKMTKAKSSGRPLYISRKDYPRLLDRSLIVTERGDRFICFNRKKLGDACLAKPPVGKAYDPGRKTITKAYSLKTGESFASAGIKVVREGELRALKAFQGEEGFIQVETMVRCDNLGARILFEMCELGCMAKYWRSFKREEFQSVFNQTVKAVAYMHHKGWVHRDIKPQNIFLTKKRGFLEVKLGDFGYACLRSDYKQLEENVGTSAFVSPELASRIYYGREFNLFESTKMDVWSIGVSFFRRFSKSLCEEVKTFRGIATHRDRKEPANKKSIEYVCWNMLRRHPKDRVDMPWVLQKMEEGIDWPFAKGF